MNNELIERIDEYLHADANGMLSDSTPDDLLADCKAEIEQLRSINDSLRIKAEGIAPPTVDCRTCTNRGATDGLSQESHCDHCMYQETWRTNHDAPKENKCVLS